MKSLEKLMRKMEPAHDSKWAKFHPAWDALFTFAFTPGVTTRNGSHIRDGIDLKRTMFIVIIALVPCLLFGMYNTGHWHYVAEGTADGFMDHFGDKFIYGILQVLPIVVVSYGVGLGVEFIFAIKNQHAVQEGFLVSGMLIPLIVPADIPLWMVAFATVFAVVLGKEVFGGTGMNIVNVALTARAFLFFGYPTMMSGDKVWMSGISDVSKDTLDLNGVTGATPLADAAATVSLTNENSAYLESIAQLKDNIVSNPELTTQFETKIQTANSMISENTALIETKLANLPSMMEAAVGSIPGSIGETSFIAIIIGAFILLYTGIASWKILISFFLGGFGMALLFQATAVNPFMEVEPLLQIMLGGFAFGAVFMITDPVTAAQTSTGKYIYGFLGGAFAILIRVFNPAYPEGVMMAILFMNVMAPMIDHYVIQSNIKRRLKRLKTA